LLAKRKIVIPYNTTKKSNMETKEDQTLGINESQEETIDENQLRFQIELEFVQMLTHPSYLNYLAQHKYFEDPAFLNYLKYLQYWKEPQYARYLYYPNCLFFLDRLQDEQFRDECRKSGFDTFVLNQLKRHWLYYRPNREQETSNTPTKHNS
jgi:mediator of RNA polymerase II transcription subunit 31